MSQRVPAAAGALVVSLFLVLSSLPFLSPPAIAQLTSLETEDLRLIYVEGLAVRAAGPAIGRSVSWGSITRKRALARLRQLVATESPTRVSRPVPNPSPE